MDVPPLAHRPHPTDPARRVAAPGGVRRVAAPGGVRLSRRDVLRLIGLGGAGTAAGVAALEATRPGAGLAARQEIELTAEAAAAPAARMPTVADKAAELAFDLDRIFRFVADEILYEPYDGALRGATGTLWGRAGNALDQALLLAALLDEALVTHRFAVGEVDDATAATLLDATGLDAAAARERDVRVQLASGPAPDPFAPQPAGDDPALTPEQEELTRQADAARRRQLDLAAEQLEAGLSSIHDALAGAGIALPAAEPTLPESERRRHVWLQVADGPVWVDLDPSIPGAEAGTAYATPTETLAALPPELDHLVRFRVVAEVVGGGEPQPAEVLLYEAPSRDLVGVPLGLIHVKPSDLEGLGLTISSVLTGTKSYLPTILVGPDAITSDVGIAFGTGGGALDLLDGDEASREGDTLAEWLQVGLVAPDGTTRLAERTIFDRVGAAKRAAGELDLAEIPPIEELEVPEIGAYYLPLLGATALSVAGWQVPAGYFLALPPADDAFAELGLAGAGYHLLRDRLALDQGTARGYRLFPDRPNVAALVFTPELPADGGEPTVTIAFDLLHRDSGFAPVAGETPVVHPRVLAGVLGHVAERVALDATWAEDYLPAGETVPVAGVGVGRIFAEAAAQGIAVQVLEPDGLVFGAGFQPPADAQARIDAALAAGSLVIVPERPVAVDGRDVLGWWLFDPATGETRDELADGRGGVVVGLTLGAPLVEYAIKVGNVALRAIKALRKLACLAAVLAIASGALWTISAVQAGVTNPGGTANYFAAGLATLSGIAGFGPGCLT